MPNPVPVILLAALVLPGCASPEMGEGFDATDGSSRIRAITVVARTNDTPNLPKVADALNDNAPAVRVAAIATLRQMTGTDLGYNPWASPQDRQDAPQKYKAYFNVHAQAQTGGDNHAITPQPPATQALNP